MKAVKELGTQRMDYEGTSYSFRRMTPEERREREEEERRQKKDARADAISAVLCLVIFGIGVPAAAIWHWWPVISRIWDWIR